MIVIDQLADYGIDTYFIVTGGVICPFVDAVGKSKRVKYYCFQHEQGASMAAEGFYRASGKIGAVLATSGPGAQNLLNGICGCWYDSIPCLFITGQVNTNESLETIVSKPRQSGFQETPICEIFASCTLFSEKIRTSNEVFEIFSKALNLLMSTKRKGPVHIDFPINLQIENIQGKINIEQHPELYQKIQPFQLNNSKRPLVIVGAGCRNCNIDKWLTVPFVSSWGAFDVVKEHPLFVGNHGVYGDRVANFALQNADLLIILGSRMDSRQTGSNVKACSPNSKKIMVDIDIEEISKMSERGFFIDVPIVNTVQNFISNVQLNIECSEWSDTIQMWKREFGKEFRDGNVYSFLENIQFPEECIIIPDCGGNLTWVMQTIKLTSKQKLFTNLGNSSMGYALPASIGASLANPGVPVVCISGDGGIQMNIQELETIRHLKLPITTIILNNNGYGIIRQFQDTHCNSRYTATSSDDLYGTTDGINLAKIAEAYGIDSKRIKVEEGIVVSFTHPVFYDVEIEPKQKIYPKMDFGSTLENMSPLRPELLKFMLV